MMSCIVGALLCGAHSANMVIAGPVAHAAPSNASWNYAVYAQPVQYVPPVAVRPPVLYAQRTTSRPVQYAAKRGTTRRV
jgi:hypothetical protein